jgi:hypothetical protein|tara:strand:+ start:3485 stop:4231 length:747 start_codon:yes stop_codon:yes gene_type:complete
MAIFVGNWFDPEGVPFTYGAAHTDDGPQGSVTRVSSQHPKKRVSDRRQTIRAIFGGVARWWKDILTATEQLEWDGSETFPGRDGTSLLNPRGFERFMQTQTASLYSGIELMLNPDEVRPIQIRNPVMIWAGALSNEAIIGFEYKQLGDPPHRTAMFASQIPYKNINSDAAWKYAYQVAVQELEYADNDDDWHYQEEIFSTQVPMVAGRVEGFYFRFLKFSNTSPGVVNIQNVDTVEDWSSLQITATDD